MLGRDGYLPGVRAGWTPASLIRRSPSPSTAVSSGGISKTSCRPGSAGRYFIARLRGGDVAAVGHSRKGPPRGAGWKPTCGLRAPQSRHQVIGAARRVVMDPVDVLDAGRMAVFTDPEGCASWCLAGQQHRVARHCQPARFVELQRLNTRDPEGAKSFYGSVFGWERLALQGRR